MVRIFLASGPVPNFCPESFEPLTDQASASPLRGLNICSIRYPVQPWTSWLRFSKRGYPHLDRCWPVHNCGPKASMQRRGPVLPGYAQILSSDHIPATPKPKQPSKPPCLSCPFLSRPPPPAPGAVETPAAPAEAVRGLGIAKPISGS